MLEEKRKDEDRKVDWGDGRGRSLRAVGLWEVFGAAVDGTRSIEGLIILYSIGYLGITDTAVIRIDWNYVLCVLYSTNVF